MLTYELVGHHEFGQGQLPFDLGVAASATREVGVFCWALGPVLQLPQGLGGVEFIRYEDF